MGTDPRLKGATWQESRRTSGCRKRGRHHGFSWRPVLAAGPAAELDRSAPPSGTANEDLGTIPMPLLSINVGLPRDVDWRGGTVRTSIFKSPASGRGRVTK